MNIQASEQQRHVAGCSKPPSNLNEVQLSPRVHRKCTESAQKNTSCALTVLRPAECHSFGSAADPLLLVTSCNIADSAVGTAHMIRRLQAAGLALPVHYDTSGYPLCHQGFIIPGVIICHGVTHYQAVHRSQQCGCRLRLGHRARASCHSALSRAQSWPTCWSVEWV